jgi:hypothetical protein
VVVPPSLLFEGHGEGRQEAVLNFSAAVGVGDGKSRTNSTVGRFFEENRRLGSEAWRTVGYRDSAVV